MQLNLRAHGYIVFIMETKTNVMRILDAHHVPYKSYSYVGTGATSGDAVAAALHQNPAQVFKTLVTTGRSGNHYVFMIPVKERGNVARLEENWLTLSACKDYQFNQEMKVPQVGKLTYALYTASLKGNVTMEGIKVFMAKHRGILPQTPVLSGKTDKYTISDFISIEP